ncbi:MAG: hypothetical protein IJ783_08055 [Kiritimatiellae bacterium]|nr:hypothetical protein [Kiritimatiellia bacterium]MBR1837227.1 hypothetical protein [Kiritimatiellia bacterium]
MSDTPADTPPAAPAAPEESQELPIEEVPETDILFECPHCGKSLSIDPRGAGLVIRCTQCHEPVTVPIPDGMELDDFDATPEELSLQLLHARQTVSRLQEKVRALEDEAAQLRAFRDDTMRRASDREDAMASFRKAVRRALEAQADASRNLQEVAAAMDVALGIPPS